MDKQMFMMGFLWVYDPAGCFINFSWHLQSQVLRLFAFAIFCELKVPSPGEILLAIQSLVKDTGYLVLPSIKQSLAAGIICSLHMRYDLCCESTFTACHLGHLSWCVWRLLCGHSEDFSWYLAELSLVFSLPAYLQLVKWWQKLKEETHASEEINFGKTGAQAVQEGVRMLVDTHRPLCKLIKNISFITYC